MAMRFLIGRNKRKYLSIYVVVIADAAPSLPRSHLVDRLAAVVVSSVRDVVDELPLKPPSGYCRYN